jgi:molybdopterin-dependent oxidoreductase alpha subunit
VSALNGWHDHELEEAGRVAAPLRWDPATDRYLEVSWEDAFAEIGRELNTFEPNSAVFYTSGRASLETAYMYQPFARMYGTNNLPDSSNMCHESTSVGLKEAIGVGVGTITLDDFEKTDLMFFFGQNVGTNSPRMLHQLQDARKRGVPIITFNPIREPGLVSFVNPQSPMQMLTPGATQISTQYHQVKAGGDSAAIMGICKALLEADDEAVTTGKPRLLVVDFIEEHTTGFEEFAAFVRQTTGRKSNRSAHSRARRSRKPLPNTAVHTPRNAIYCFRFGTMPRRVRYRPPNQFRSESLPNILSGASYGSSGGRCP